MSFRALRKFFALFRKIFSSSSWVAWDQRWNAGIRKDLLCDCRRSKLEVRTLLLSLNVRKSNLAGVTRRRKYFLGWAPIASSVRPWDHTANNDKVSPLHRKMEFAATRVILRTSTAHTLLSPGFEGFSLLSYFEGTGVKFAHPSIFSHNKYQITIWMLPVVCWQHHCWEDTLRMTSLLVQ